MTDKAYFLLGRPDQFPVRRVHSVSLFFFYGPATTEIYTCRTSVVPGSWVIFIILGDR